MTITKQTKIQTIILQTKFSTITQTLVETTKTNHLQTQTM